MEDITNFVQLTDLVATSGQPTRDQLRHISTLGYLAVVNLALADSDRAIPDEGSVVAGLGMSYTHIPVRFDRPTVDDLRLFIGTMRALEGRKVWVHCVLNFRVSAFMYHYLRQEKGYQDTESRSPVLDRWQPRMEPVWAGFLELTREEIGAWSDGGLTSTDK